MLADRYTLESLLGEGTIGSVWLARDGDREVAIKIVHGEVARNPQALARFGREAAIARQVESPHVVALLDHGVTDDGAHFIVMEHIDGETLQERLEERGKLTLEETHRVVDHVCSALAVAHDAGLVHRDIKPANIFLARGPDGDTAKVLDFGVAKATDVMMLDGVDPTRTGALMGTPTYMSPEQAKGLKSIDWRADLWSVAVVAFECLTGTRPFEAQALGPLVQKILMSPIPKVSELAPNTSDAVDAWMKRALERDPAARFQSARELCDTLGVAAGLLDPSAVAPAAPPRSAAARQETASTPIAPEQRRNRAIVAVIVVLALLAVIGAVAFLR